MARVYEGQSVGLNRLFGPVERLLYRLFGTREDAEMNWKTYAVAMLLFNLLGLLVVYLLAAAAGGCCRSTRKGLARSRPTRRSTPRSASPPTPTGRATAAK